MGIDVALGFVLLGWGLIESAVNLGDLIASKKEQREYLGFMQYTVQQGDTLWKIAKDFNLTYGEILKFNTIKDINKIYAGTTLVIPIREREQ